jgi:hypothetical protein
VHFTFVYFVDCAFELKFTNSPLSRSITIWESPQQDNTNQSSFLQSNFKFPPSSTCTTTQHANSDHPIKTHRKILHYRKTLHRDETEVIELVLANIVAICQSSASIVIVVVFLLPQLQNQHILVLIN